MQQQAAVVFDDTHHIPQNVYELETFRRWALSRSFPSDIRVDFLAGEIAVTMSPEDLYTHGTVKTSLVAALHRLISEPDRGVVFADSTRLSSPEADVSVEPDVLVVLHESFETEQIREVPAASQRPGRFVELEGAADLVIEIISDHSTTKDTRRLPPLLAKAGVREFWSIDARGPEILFEVRSLVEPSRFEIMAPDSGGWRASRMLGGEVRLLRWRNRRSRWSYGLEFQI